MEKQTSQFDLIIIGGGPAGLMAAGRAGELGARVLVLEQGRQLGAKLLATGGGRCNLSNYILEPRQLARAYGRNGNFLLSGLSRFGVAETLALFERLGIATKVEARGRVFPTAESALAVRDALVTYVRTGGAVIRTGAAVARLLIKEGRLTGLALADGSQVSAANYLFATGGKSYPALGATGDGYKWAGKLGHTLEPLWPALSPIRVSEAWVKDLQGLSLREAGLSVWQGRARLAEAQGDLLFMADGLTGPAAHDVSLAVARAGRQANALVLRLDLWPQGSEAALDQELQRLFGRGKRSVKACLAGLVPQRLAEQLLRLADLPADLTTDRVDRLARRRLAGLIKALSLTPRGVVGYDKAIVTAGGVKLSEIDPKTMRSKLVPNLYFAGEVLDLHGPSGGYNLQVAWTTGYLAGESAATA